MVKKIALLSMDGHTLGDQYIFKDICLIPILLGEYLGYDVLITTEINQEKLKETFPNINFEFISFQDNYELNMNQYLHDHGNEIDIVFAFGAYPSYLQLLDTYKTSHPNGKTYLKLDMNRYWLNRLVVNTPDYLIRLFEHCDFVSAECSPIVKILEEKFQRKIHHIPNGYYDFFPTEAVSYGEKKNIILTVGRLDAPDKQVMMAVYAFLNAQLPDWELRLVGAMSEQFKEQLMNFVAASPYSNQVKILGPIFDKRQLEEEYRQAKIFCLTSKVECHAHVLAEAAKNGCYLMLTDIDGAIDMTKNQKWGRIHPIYNWPFFSESLKEVSEQEELFKTTCMEIQNFARNNLNWHHLIAKIANILGEERSEQKTDLL
ncbi:glycosyltransferase family 4 protein [Rummeliibacillus sp. POC4]|uniref:glycosyltransferase family 4 protein n=1 Tax=Rummeliibacillus sp. POC4 TaxID=2305899 RepID=UPI000E66E0F4|nr:glycosyltransferase [Rummeliibacillus sp. POC4]RIJ65303.1 glycosyltransferase family 1 protein [Rummeliibacillus sp. POC4]